MLMLSSVPKYVYTVTLFCTYALLFSIATLQQATNVHSEPKSADESLHAGRRATNGVFIAKVYAESASKAPIGPGHTRYTCMWH